MTFDMGRPGIRRAAIIALSAINIALGVGFFKASQALAEGNAAEVIIDNFTFNPEDIMVKRGTTVTFINHDDIPHNVVHAERKLFRSPVLDSDEKFTHTFDTAGIFEYFCALHPQMKGKVVVTE